MKIYCFIGGCYRLRWNTGNALIDISTPGKVKQSEVSCIIISFIYWFSYVYIFVYIRIVQNVRTTKNIYIYIFRYNVVYQVCLAFVLHLLN